MEDVRISLTQELVLQLMLSSINEGYEEPYPKELEKDRRTSKKGEKLFFLHGENKKCEAPVFTLNYKLSIFLRFFQKPLTKTILRDMMYYTTGGMLWTHSLKGGFLIFRCLPR